MDLVEGALAKQDYQLASRQFDGAPEGVEIEKAASRRIEALVDACKRIPHFPAEKQGGRFRNRQKPSVGR